MLRGVRLPRYRPSPDVRVAGTWCVLIPGLPTGLLLVRDEAALRSVEREGPISSVPALEFPERPFCHDPGVTAKANASLGLGRVVAISEDC